MKAKLLKDSISLKKGDIVTLDEAYSVSFIDDKGVFDCLPIGDLELIADNSPQVAQVTLTDIIGSGAKSLTLEFK